MGKTIRINDKTLELLTRTKKEFIAACQNAFNEAAQEKNVNECLEFDRIICEASEATDSEWFYKALYSFRRNTGLEPDPEEEKENINLTTYAEEE